MVIGFMWRPAMAARCLPTEVEPVKEILRIVGCGIRYSEISDGTPKTSDRTPVGSPASASACTRNAQELGVSSGPFRITVQPAASAAPTLRAAWPMPKFHGTKPATGPIASLKASWCTPSARAGTMRP